MRTRFIIGIVLVLVIVLVISALLIYKNYQLGQQLYTEANSMLNEIMPLAEALEQLESEFSNPDVDHKEVNRAPFDSSITTARLAFSVFHNDMPISDDVRLAYFDLVERLFVQTLNDNDNAKLAAMFLDPEKAAEMAHLRHQLDTLIDTLTDFIDGYNQMTDLEIIFHSWKKAHIALTEKIRTP